MRAGSTHMNYVVKEYLHRKLSMGHEISLVQPLHCKRSCICTTSDIIECEVWKEIRKAQGRDAGVQKVLDRMERRKRDLLEGWRDRGQGPPPVLRTLVACGKIMKGVAMEDILLFRAAMTARQLERLS